MKPKKLLAWVIFIIIILAGVVIVSAVYEHYGFGVFIASLFAGISANVLFKLFIEDYLFQRD